jgi:hypothetical protein
MVRIWVLILSAVWRRANLLFNLPNLNDDTRLTNSSIFSVTLEFELNPSVWQIIALKKIIKNLNFFFSSSFEQCPEITRRKTVVKNCLRMEGTNSKPTIKVSYMYISKCGLVQINQDLIILTFPYIYVLTCSY